MTVFNNGGASAGGGGGWKVATDSLGNYISGLPVNNGLSATVTKDLMIEAFRHNGGFILRYTRFVKKGTYSVYNNAPIQLITDGMGDTILKIWYENGDKCSISLQCSGGYDCYYKNGYGATSTDHQITTGDSINITSSYGNDGYYRLWYWDE